MQPIEFYLNPSKKFRYYIHGLHFLTALYILSWPIIYTFNWVITYGLFLLVLMHWRLASKDFGKKLGKKAVFRIWQNSKKKWGFETIGGIGGIGVLMGDSFKSSLFIILRIKTKTRVQTIFIPRDVLSPIEYRVLLSRVTNL